VSGVRAPADDPGWRIGPDIAVVERDGVAYLAVLPDGPILVLDPVATVVWDVARAAPAERLAAGVAEAFGMPVAAVAPHAERIVGELVSAGVLVPEELP